MTWSTATNAFGATTLADGLVGAWNGFWLVLFSALEIGKPSGLGVDVVDLLLALNIEVSDLLACGCAQSLFKIAGQTAPCAHGLI